MEKTGATPSKLDAAQIVHDALRKTQEELDLRTSELVAAALAALTSIACSALQKEE